MQRFKAGSFQIALQSGLPVVPLSIVGTRQIMRKGDLAARPGVVRLVLHEPIGAVLPAVVSTLDGLGFAQEAAG